MGTANGAGGSGNPASSLDAVAEAAREMLAGLANQIDEVAAWLAPGTPAGSFAEGIAAEVSGELSALFAEVGELLARLIATLIAILEALVKVLRAGPSESTRTTTTTPYQDIAVAIGRDRS